VEARARHCRFCASAVATVRCAACLTMNAPDALCCSGCGRELGLSPPSRKVSETCPRCASKLDAIHHERGLALDCSACGGQFAEHPLLKDLLRSRARVGALLKSHPRRVELTLGPVKYLRCPECDVFMNRRNFGGTSGVVVDVCHLHGTWFDAGELAAVLAFVESGGPLEAKLPVTRAAPSLGLGALTRTERDEASLAGAALELLAFVIDIATD
jgi:Zn-finger nucleic acid-binding protein